MNYKRFKENFTVFPPFRKLVKQVDMWVNKLKNVSLFYFVFGNHEYVLAASNSLYNFTSLLVALTDLNRHGSNLALPISTDCHRGLHCWKIVFNQAIHRRPLCAGVRPNSRGGFLLPPGGDRTWETH